MLILSKEQSNKYQSNFDLFFCTSQKNQIQKERNVFEMGLVFCYRRHIFYSFIFVGLGHFCYCSA